MPEQLVNRRNWPVHCGIFIQFERSFVERTLQSGQHGHVAHQIEFSCRTCRMRGSFDDFDADERQRKLKWATFTPTPLARIGDASGSGVGA